MSLKWIRRLVVAVLVVFLQPCPSCTFAATASERSAEELNIEELVKAGDIGEALQASERLRARDLLARLGKGSVETIGTSAIQQKLLAGDTLLLEYLLGETKSFLWAVTSTSIVVYELPPRSVIEPLARELRESLTRSGQPAFRARAELVANRLSAILLAPVAKQLAGESNLALVLEGCLEGIPFAVLPNPSDLRSPLVLHHEIVTLPSASTLAALRLRWASRPPGTKTLAILADPVFGASDPRIAREPKSAKVQVSSLDESRGPRWEPSDLPRLRFSREEAEAIRRLLPEKATLTAFDFDASRELAVSGELGGFRILHFATHAIQGGSSPGLSGIVLSQFDRNGRPQEGFLSGETIRSLNLSADLVVLSACQTGLGDDEEGLDNLSRDFLAAGAYRVVASLWPVSDAATSRLMMRFYRGLLVDRLRPSLALRRAQLELMRDARWSSPLYWAGFVLQGDWR